MNEHHEIKRIKSRAHDILRTLRLVWRVTPRLTSINLFLVVVQGLLPLAALYLMKKVIDTVSVIVKGTGRLFTIHA